MTVREPRVSRLAAIAVLLVAVCAADAPAAAVAAPPVALPAGTSPHGGGYLNPPGFIPRKKGPVGEGETKRRDAPYPTDPGSPGRPGTPGPQRGPVAPGQPAPGGGPLTGGIVLEIDPTRWQDWWELNRDPYLRVREALRAPGAVTGSDAFFMGAGRVRPVDTLAPDEVMVRERIAPRLLRLLRSDPHRDLESSCLIALAKVGQDRSDFDVVPILAERLQDPDQEVRETAALSLGLCGAADAVPLLAQLARDDQSGRRAAGRARVEDRVRAFASYGLAISARTADPERRRVAYDTLAALLDDADLDRDIHVAAILGIGILDPDSSLVGDRRLRMEAIERLRRTWDEDTGPARAVVRCHAATSIARLLEGAGDATMSSFFVDRFTKVVADQDAAHDLRRAAALAIGWLGAVGSSGVGDDVRARAVETLREVFDSAKDLQTRYFALVALGRIGDDDARAFLLEVLARGQRALERPWAALALGALCHARREAGDVEVDTTVAAAIRAQLDDVKNPEARAAFAVGIGLVGDATAADDLRELLEDVEAQDELAGHVCVGLALLRDPRAIPRLRELVRTSSRRPQRLREASVALGALGDREAADVLVELLAGGDATLAQLASVSVGLGLIGDERSIDPLLAIAADEGASDLARAFAVVAIGKIVERGDLPWTTPLAVGFNYRAAVETLVDGVRGVLDLH